MESHCSGFTAHLLAAWFKLVEFQLGSKADESRIRRRKHREVGREPQNAGISCFCSKMTRTRFPSNSRFDLAS